MRELLEYEPTLPSDAPIFILASGQRCGSTLLLRLVNSYADALLWGEHHGALNAFLTLHEDLQEWESRFAGNRRAYLLGRRDEFLPNMVPEASEIRTAAKAYLVNLFALPAAKLGKPVWGFKEVRYGAKVALFLQDLFPDCRIIHLTRDLADCFISMKRWEIADDLWDRKLTERAVWDWVRVNSSLREVADRLTNLWSIRYEDMVEDPGGFVDELAAFLGVDASAFDTSVFDHRLHGQSPRSPDDRPVTLDAEAVAFLSDPAILDAAREYGYGDFLAPYMPPSRPVSP